MTLDRMSEIDSKPEVPQPRPATHDRQGRGWTVAAAVVVALIALAGVVVVVVTRDSPPPPRAQQPPTPAAPSASPAGEATPPPGDQAVPTAAPADVTWSLFQGVALPSSPTAGPTRTEGAVHAGYSLTPEGALLAAAQIGARHLITPREGWRQVVQQQVVPGPGRDAFVRARAQVTTDQVPAGTYGQIAGFRFVTYSPDTAVIQLVTRFRNGNLQVSTPTLRWVNGDWKLQLQPDGSASPTVQSVSSLAGFVPWGGV